MKKSFQQFIEDAERRAADRKPVKTRDEIRGSLGNMRNYRIAIREAALRGVTCILLYRKVTTNEVKRYEVIPTEYAYRRNKQGGIRKVLWVQDVRDKKDRRQIKCFYMRNILKAVLTDRRLVSKWPIKIK